MPTHDNAFNSFFRTRKFPGDDLFYIAAKTATDPNGNSHTAVQATGQWHTNGQNSTQLSVLNNPAWIATFAQAQAAEPGLRAFVVGFDRYGVKATRQIISVDPAQSTVTLDRELSFEAAAPGGYELAFALPDHLSGRTSSTGLFNEFHLSTLAELFVDNPDIDGVPGTNDPYSLSNTLATLRLVAGQSLGSGAKVGRIYFNDPRAWTQTDLKVEFYGGHYGRITVEVVPPPLTRELPAEAVTPVREMLDIISDFSLDDGQGLQDQSIPGLDDTQFSDLVSPTESLQMGLVNPANEFLTNNPEPDVDGLLKAVGGGSSIDAAAVTGFRHVGSQYLFDIRFTDRTQRSLPLDLGLGADLPFDLSITFDVMAEFNFDFTLGVDLAALNDPDNALSIQVRDLSARVVIETYDLDAALRLGFLEAGIDNGRVVLEAKLSTLIDDPNRDGRLTLGELKSHSFASLIDVAFVGSLSANLPIVAKLGSFTTSTTTPPRIVVTDTDLFAGPPPAVSFVDFDQIANFLSFDTASILVLLRASPTACSRWAIRPASTSRFRLRTRASAMRSTWAWTSSTS